MAWRVLDDHTIQLECVYIEAHGGCNKRTDLWEAYGVSCNEAGICNSFSERIATERICSDIEFYSNRLKLYASEDKHALYPTCQACEAATLVVMGTSEALIAGAAALIVPELAPLLPGIALGAIFYYIYELFTWWLEDDHLQDAVMVLNYEDLERGWVTNTGAGTPQYMHLGSFAENCYYQLWWHIENEEFPYVRIVLDELRCRKCDGDDWSDEPYLAIVGFSLFPEVRTWVPEPIPPVDDDVDDGEQCEDINQFFRENSPYVVFEGEVSPYSVIGFSVSLFEDDGLDTSESERRDIANEISRELYERLSGEEGVGGECGENILRRIFGLEVGEEDCSGGGVYRFPVYNVGEPDHLFIPKDEDLSQYGFPGEYIYGRECGGKMGFCGGLRCDNNCASPIAKFMMDFEDDVAVFRPSNRMWYYDIDHNGNTDDRIGPWGWDGDLPIAGDFDRDGFEDDVAVFRDYDRKWFYDYDHDGDTDYIIEPWGWEGDIPIAGDFDRDGIPQKLRDRLR